MINSRGCAVAVKERIDADRQFERDLNERAPVGPVCRLSIEDGCQLLSDHSPILLLQRGKQRCRQSVSRDRRPEIRLFRLARVNHRSHLSYSRVRRLPQARRRREVPTQQAEADAGISYRQQESQNLAPHFFAMVVRGARADYRPSCASGRRRAASRRFLGCIERKRAFKAVV